MSFSSLASGCSFDASRGKGERRLFGGASGSAAPAATALGLGSLDFFGESAPAPPPAPALAERRRRKPSAAEADAAAAAAGGGAAAALTEREVADANALRKAMRIHAYGGAIPAPVQSAEQMADRFAMKPWLRRNVLEAGYHELTRVQMQAVPLLIEGRELLACAPTGSGKTAAFLLPLLARLGNGKRQGLRAVAIAPTQELARQTHRELLKLSAGSSFAACVLTKKMAAAATAHAARGGGVGAAGAAGEGAGVGGDPWKRYDVLVCTPLRLVSMIKKGAVALGGVQYLVLDEADKLLELGFLEQVDDILAACSHKDVQRALFSATMLPAVEDLARSVLRTPARLVVGEKNAASEIIEQKLVFCGREDGKMVALRQLVREGIKPPVLIFVQSVERAVELFHELVYDGLNVDVIHAERSQAQREATVSKFRAGKVWVLIATELVARGMDFKGVSLVVNYDFPQTTTSYIHRIGRTGRAGRAGRAVTFFTESDSEQLRSIANVMKASGCPVADWMLRIKPMPKDERRRRAVNPLSRKSITKRQRDGDHSSRVPREEEEEDDDDDGGGEGRSISSGGARKSKKKKARK